MGVGDDYNIAFGGEGGGDGDGGDCGGGIGGGGGFVTVVIAFVFLLSASSFETADVVTVVDA